MNRANPEYLPTEAEAVAALRDADPARSAATKTAPANARSTASALDERARADLQTILAMSPGLAVEPAPAPAKQLAPVRLLPPGRKTTSPLAGKSRRQRVLWTALPIAATAAAATAVLFATMQPPQPALASWTPVPVTAPGALVSDEDIDQWTSQCTDLVGGGLGLSGAEAPNPDAPRTVLVDRRGDVTYCLDYYRGSATDADPTVLLGGLRGPDVQITWGTTIGSGGPVPNTPEGGDVLTLGGNSTTDRPVDEVGSSASDAGQAFSQSGLAGPDVTGVDVVLTNGLHVTASLQDGLWGAWWPSEKGDVIGAQLLVHTIAGDRIVDPASAGLKWD